MTRHLARPKDTHLGTPRKFAPLMTECLTCGRTIEKSVGETWRHPSNGSEHCPPRDEWAAAIATRLMDVTP